MSIQVKVSLRLDTAWKKKFSYCTTFKKLLLSAKNRVLTPHKYEKWWN